MSRSIKWLQNTFFSPEDKPKNVSDIYWSSSDTSEEENTVFTPKRLCSQKTGTELIIDASLRTEVVDFPKLSQIKNGSTSPVIKKRRKFIKRKRRKYRNQEKPDLKDSEVIISPGRTEALDSTICIQTFPSQYGSQVGDDWLSKRVGDDFFKKPHSICSKKIKHKGLALELERVLKLQKSRTSFWKLEIDKNNINSLFDKNSIHLYIRKQWEEYGNFISECRKCGKEQNPNIYLLIVNKKLDVGNMYAIFPPFSIQEILYNNEMIKCLFNVTKYIQLK